MADVSCEEIAAAAEVLGVTDLDLVAKALRVASDAKKSAWPFGCHCDVDVEDTPDGCVIGTPDSTDCIYAKCLEKEGKTSPSDCGYWRQFEPSKNAA